MSTGIRKEFYNSKAWKSTRKNIWIKQNLLCNRCHKPVYVDGISEWLPKDKRRIGIVHHKEYLDNINIADYNITLREDNLEGLCKDCHEKTTKRIQEIKDRAKKDIAEISFKHKN